MEAPVCALVDAMSKLPAKLHGLLRRHGHMLPRGAEDEIPLIIQDLDKIMAILQDHDRPTVEDGTMMIGCLMKEARELSYDIDDCIDQYEQAAAAAAAAAAGSRSISARIPRRRNSRRGSKTTRLPEKLKRRLWMANKIREFSVRSQEALGRYSLFSRDGVGAAASRCDTSFGFWHLRGEHANHLVGIDGPMNTLEVWLAKGGEQKLKFVSIVGSGGVGKTTLASEVYHRIGGQFECHAFVQSSQKPDIRRLLISFLSQIQPNQPPSNWKVHSLIAHIRAHLQDKRYLIVVDDVWATTTWDIVNYALPDGNCNSRILITTEIEDVALKCCGYDPSYVFKMKPLGEDDSRKIFLSAVVAPPESIEISNSIIRKCGGLPLATVTIASLLASQMGKPEQWNYVDKFLSYGLRTNPTLQGMQQVLNLSYNNLPPHLKACLLYLSIYQEGHVIWKDDLAKQWIAEGFIRATEGKDEEEMSGAYFDELISSRMIQPIYTSDTCEILSCTVHYMVVDFVKHKSNEENFVTAIDHSQTSRTLSDKVRRLSLHFGNAEDAAPPTNMRLSQVRTLAFFGVISCLPSMIEFRLLQVLILQFWGDDESISLDLTTILELFRLRYLQVTCNVNLEVQATKVQGLKFLETLKIDARASTVPEDITHLPHLLHLILPADTNLPNGIGHMTSLRTLGYFDIGTNSMETLQRLGKLTNLQDLQLTIHTLPSENLKNNMLCLGSILCKLSNLKSLTLAPVGVGSSCINCQNVAVGERMIISGDDLSNVSSPQALLQRLKLSSRVCIFSSLPKWVGHLCKLSILKIGVSELTGNDVEVLRGLPALTALSLYVCTKLAEQIVFNKAGFSVIRYFKFQCSVPWLKFEAGAMPNLRKLKLGFNSSGVDQHGTAAIIIEQLSGLEDISAEIGGAGIDWESVLANTIRNHPSNPRINIQLKDCTFYGHTSMGTKQKGHMNKNDNSGEDEKKQADSGVFTLSESSSRLHISGFDMEVLLKKAMSCWLKPSEVLYILENYERFWIPSKTPNKPASGSLFLQNRRLNRFFRKDGHEWRKNKNGGLEAHKRLKVGNVDALSCYYAYGRKNPYFQRRCYWMLEPAYDHIVLVHYMSIAEGNSNLSCVTEVSSSLQTCGVTETGQSYSNLSSVTEVSSRSASKESNYNVGMLDYNIGIPDCNIVMPEAQERGQSSVEHTNEARPKDDRGLTEALEAIANHLLGDDDNGHIYNSDQSQE
ncbi:disease resistance protein RGA5-like [Triticum dicoccoides]|uniref:disease resistance protein RGA5-like n=1 Tax=Triticum dicoccoides TaxID=85692 RepID=UPI00188F6F32|nr:disease resistance protein RGA5-like [Triticum dicoccoides]